MTTVRIDAEKMIVLLRHSMLAGTQNAAIDVAIEWIEAAERRIHELETVLEELQKALDDIAGGKT